MPLTATWQTVPVFGTWRNYDGTLRAGAYKVNLLVRVVNDNAGVKTIFSKGQFAAGTLNTSNNSLPSFTVDVPATDDPQNTPTGFQLVVEVDLGLDPFAADAPTETFVIDVPLSALPTGINLADVVLPDTIPLPAPGLTKGVAGGIAELDADGDVLDADGTKILAGGGGGSGPVDWDDVTDKPTTFTPSAHTHDVDDINATGTSSGTTYLRGDGTWSTPAGGGTSDHGALTGLGDDDHTQYARTDGTRGDFAAPVHTHAATEISNSGAAGRSIIQAEATADVKTILAYTKGDISLGSVDNTADVDKPISTLQQAALDLKAPLASPAFSGTPTGITKTHVGLGNVDNTNDADKPISNAAQTALNLKAPLASPAFTGTPTGITKAHVGLGNVDNTTDLAKPISTATQAVLDGKAEESHTHDISDVTGLQVALDNRVLRSGAVGYRFWTGTAGVGSWSARPTGYLYVEAFSDGTATSSRDPNAPAPTGDVNGDRWWQA